MKKHTLGALGAAAVIGGSFLVAALPASADLTTSCSGEAGAVTVPGDLVVAANKACTLTGTTVTGNVRVASGADLIVNNGKIAGRVTGAVNAYLELNDTTVTGDLVLANAYGSYLDNSTVGGLVRSTTAADAGSNALVYLQDSSIAGDLRTSHDEVYLDGADVAGTVTSTDSRYTDIYRSFLDGKLTISGSELGSVICGTAVQGNASFTGYAGLLQIGADGPTDTCTTGSYWGGNIAAKGNLGGTYLDNNLVRGNVVLSDNVPMAQYGSRNVVRGKVTGDYNDWDGSAPAAKQRAAVAQQATADRSADPSAKVSKRHAAAVAAAAKAGTAKIGR